MNEQELFLNALQKTDLQERLTYLRQACGDDDLLRKRVGALLATHAQQLESDALAARQEGTFIEDKSPVNAAVEAIDDEYYAARAKEESVGATIGPYKLLQKLGQGGMGTVWMAEQKHPVRRTVALKLVKAGMDTSEVISRFQAERQALALMNHTNIANVLDAGATESGRPYFVMELVRGIPITAYCDQHRLPAEKRLELMLSVCDAVQHAHQKGIIHRDIKPSNVLVTQQDDKPVVKIIDFGLAKATGSSLTERTLVTAIGQMVGTPAYMSPEQADYGVLDVDTRTDVYSLGVLLYELLTGVTPLDLQKLRAAGYTEIQRLIREQEPLPMSLRLSSLGVDSKVTADKRATDPRRLAYLLSGDLNVVVMKALEKDRSRRYPSPGDFAADVQRFLRNEAVEARPASAVYRLSKLVRRHKTAVVTTGVVTLSLLIGSAFSIWQAFVATKALAAERTANDVATKRLSQLENVNSVLASIFRELDPSEEENGGLPLRAQLGKQLDGAANLLNGDAIGDPLMVASLQMTLGVTQRRLGHFDKAVTLLQQALAVREKLLGDDHAGTLDTLAELARSQHSSGNTPEALKLWERVSEGQKSVLGPIHRETLISQSELAFALSETGERQKALELQREACAALAKTNAPESKEAIECLSRLGLQLFDVGDREHDQQAAASFEEIVRRFTQLYGADHYSTYSSMGNLAAVSLSLDENDKAVSLYETALAGVRKKVGPDHILSARLGCALASACDAAGQSEKAMTIMAENVVKIRKLLGDTHPDAMHAMNNLAFMYEQNDKLDDAIPLHTETLQLRRGKLGNDHPDTLESQSNLAWCLRRAGRFAESIDLYRQARPGMVAQHGAEHDQTISFLNNFSHSLLMGQKFEEAETVLRECLPLQEQKYPDGWRTFRAKAWLGQTLLNQQKLDEAEPLLLAGYEGLLSREEKLPEHARIVLNEIPEQIVKLYATRNAAGDADHAEKWRSISENRTASQQSEAGK